MIEINKKLKYIKDILAEACEDNNVYHYVAESGKYKYVVWQEQGEDSSFYKDNEKAETRLQIDVDLYTKEEYDELVDKINNAFIKRSSSCESKLVSIQYENETGYIHYSWQVFI